MVQRHFLLGWSKTKKVNIGISTLDECPENFIYFKVDEVKN